MKTRRDVTVFAIAGVTALAVGCVAETSEDTSALDGARGRGKVRFLDQGWDATTRAAFYQTTQGSRMLPYAWFLHLEQADNKKPLRASIRGMGFLDDGPSSGNPDGLPVGFARDVDAVRGDAIGLTCAACHTGQVEYRGTKIRIDGGQSLGDLEALQQAFHDSLAATLDRPRKLDRFATAILGRRATTAQRDALRADMVKVRDWWSARIARSRGLSPHGPSRTDAFTIIGNEVACALFEEPRNCEPGVAPTQFPFLWGTPDFEWAQYNSSVHSPLGRNVGEVTGVFAEAKLEGSGAQLTLVSSANLENLHDLETWLKALQAPQWDERYLPAIDTALAARGEELYAAQCASCHAETAPRTAPNAFGKTFAQTSFSTPLAALGTDPTAAVKFATRRAFPGPFAGIAGAQGLLDDQGKSSVAALLNISGSMIIGRFFAASGFTDAQKVAYLDLRESRSPSIPQLTTYRARPLDGIAFTAPYLHNGSVPSMYELLLPPAQRTAQFCVGSKELDPVHLGVSTACEDGAVLLDTAQVGNGNGGHVYGTDLSEADRMALIEYLKTL